MFQAIPTAPPDPILGLSAAFAADPRPGKINLSVGVFQDESGKTPVLASVKEAERRLLTTETTKLYKPIDGDSKFGRQMRELLFGKGHELVDAGRAITAHTPGGTGALRVVGDFLRGQFPELTVWMSDPTWANHGQVFQAAGLKTKSYAYFDKQNNALAFPALMEALERIPAGDAVLLHASCHNPCGVDPTPEQWAAIGELTARRGLFPLIDFAYQGFGATLEEDAVAVRTLVQKNEELAICSSCSKNFGLYNERTGALTLTCKSKEHAASVQSQVKVCIRANYSNPPAHGAAIVTTILEDSNLRAEWEKEVDAMRHHIAGMRKLFVRTLDQLGAGRDFSFIERQKGMFSFSGLAPEQVERLRSDHAIYVVGSGRINVAGMSERTMPALCQAIVSVL
jgi:aspartate/tyrosine/aromatic aminotransferase